MHPATMLAPVVLGASVACAQCDLTLVAPDDLLPGDGFGVASVISPDHALVGAYDALLEAGVVYTLRRTDDQYALTGSITAGDVDAYDQFGSDVAVVGDLAVVGAPLDEANGFASGSAYVFRYVGGRWIELAKLLAADGAPYDLYGLHTATDGVHAFVACPEDDETEFGAGSVYVYGEGRDGAWPLLQKLQADDAAESDRFGESVDADGATLLVGCSQKQAFGAASGAAYVFVARNGVWTQQAELFAPDPGPDAEFGLDVGVSGDLAIVGAPKDDLVAPDAGAAYVYRRVRDEWVFEATLVGDDEAASDGFGSAVDIDGATAIIGSRAGNGPGGPVGAAYVFRRAIGGAWTQVDRLAPSPLLDAAYFGWSVGVSADRAIVGAPFGAGPQPGTGSAFVVGLDPCVCAADLDVDGVLGILDFVALQEGFLAGDPGADINRDGDLTVLDFVAFQALFVAGCG